MDLASGKSERVFPGISITDYDISREETEVVFTTTDGNRESRISLAALNRLAPPREIVRGGDQVSFGADDDLFFRSLDTNALIRIRKDGTGRERVIPLQ